MQLAASLTAVFQTSFLEPSQRPAVPPRRGFDFYDRRESPRLELCCVVCVILLRCIDPPYYVPSKRVFREYSSQPFSADDLARLSVTLEHIDRRGAKVLLSYPDCSIIKKISKNWLYSRIDVRRTVAGEVSRRKNARELLIRNYEI
jgi:hypothetical protein